MSKALSSASVIIIEDDENSRLIIQRLLEIAGVRQIASFDSGSTALASLQEPADLVLLDLQLRSEDGYQLIRQFRQDNRLRPAAIVALTADVLQGEQKARSAGFDAFIGKPLHFERFCDQLQKVLDGKPIWQTR